jgi:hypothetical protein
MQLCHSKLQIKKQCCGSALASMRIRIHLFNSIPGTHPDPGSQTNGEPDANPGQTLTTLKGEFLHEKYTLCRL